MSDPGQILRRSFVAIATSSYQGWPDLGEVGQEVSTLEGWLCNPALGPRRFKRRFPELADSPTEARVRKRLGKRGRFSPADAVVLYVTGHGQIDDNRDHYTVLADATPQTLATTCVETKNLLKWLREQPGLDEVLVVLDLCQAGNLADCITPQMRQTLDGRWLVLGTSAADGTAKLRAFTDTVAEVLAELRSGPDTTEREEYLDSEFFFRMVRDKLQKRHGQTLVKIIDPGRRMTCLPNPLYDPEDDLVAVAPSRRDLAFPPGDMAAHWVPRARGARAGDLASWFFFGRETLLRRLVDFARGPAGTLVVTGRAGCGKSAVLARLVTLSDPGFRSEHPAVVASGTVLPAEGEADVAVLATGKSATQVAEQVVLALGGTPPAAEVPTLGDWLAALEPVADPSRPSTIVLDALDEAADPQGLTQSLLRALNPPEAPRFRLLVGVRSAGDEPDQNGGSAAAGRPGLAGMVGVALGAETIAADVAPYWGDADLAAYLDRILTREGSAFASRQEEAAALAVRIAQGVQRSYLLGSMVAHQVSESPEVLPALPVLLESSVAELLARDLAAALDDAERRTAYLLLRVCALSFGRGLPWRDLWPVLATLTSGGGAAVTNDDVERFLNHRTSGYLVRDVEDGITVYRPFHDALRGALTGAGFPILGVLGVPEVRQAHAVIARHLAENVRDRDTGDGGTPPPYARRHLAEHAVAAGTDETLHEVLDRVTLPWMDGDSVSRALRLYQAPEFSELWDLLSAWRGVRSRWSWDDVEANRTALDAALLASTGWAAERRPPPTGLQWRHRWGNWTWGGTVLGRDLRGGWALAPGTVVGVPVVAVAGTSEPGEPQVQLWETSTGLALGPPLPHHERARALAMATISGRPLIAALDGDHQINLWDASTSEVRRIPLLAPTRYLAMAETAGRALLVAGGFDQAIWVYDVAAGTRLDDIPVRGTVRGLALGQDSSGHPRLVIGLRRDRASVVQQRNPLTGAEVGPPVSLPGEVNAVDWARDGTRNYLAIGTAYGVAQVYNADTGATIGPAIAFHHHQEVRTVSLDATGGRVLLAAGGYDPQAQLLDVAAGSSTPMPHPQPVVGVTFAAVEGRRMVATLTEDGDTRLWDTGGASGARRSAGESIVSLAITQTDGRILVAGGGTRTVTVWDADSDQPVLEDTWVRHNLNPKAAPTHIEVALGTVSGRTILLAGTGTHLKITDVDTLATSTLEISSLESFSGSGWPWPPSLHVGQLGAFAAVLRDGHVALFEIDPGPRTGAQEVARHQVGYVDTYLLHAERGLLLACAEDEVTELRDALTGATLTTVPARRYSRISIGRLDGHDVVTWITRSTLHVWDPWREAPLSSFPIVGSPGTTRVARVGHRDAVVAGHHSTVRAYDLRTGRVIGTFPFGTSIGPVEVITDGANGRAVVAIGGSGLMLSDLVDPSW